MTARWRSSYAIRRGPTRHDVPMILRLSRWGLTPHGTFGTLTVYSDESGAADDDDGILRSYTVVRPWLDNKTFVSCIPNGWYALSRGRYHKGGYDTLWVRDVVGRNSILIHKGNTADDVLGCIALGSRLGLIRTRWAVLQSADTFDRFWGVVSGLDGRGRIEITSGSQAPHCQSAFEMEDCEEYEP